MKLNLLEKALINSFARAFVQRRYESPLLERLGGRVTGGRVLEVGCGRGVGTEIIFERLDASEVHAFDIDPSMVSQAQRRLAGYPPTRLRLSVGDATSIQEEDASFDAVFDFMIIHHIPDWQRAVSEIARVLRPGGRFFFEEVTSQALSRWTIELYSITRKRIGLAAHNLSLNMNLNGTASQQTVAPWRCTQGTS